MNEMAKLGNLVRDARVGRGVTIEAMADSAGVSTTWLADFEKGKKTFTPAPNVLKGISQQTGIAVEEMLSILGYIEHGESAEGFTASYAVRELAKVIDRYDWRPDSLVQAKRMLAAIAEPISTPFDDQWTGDPSQ